MLQKANRPASLLGDFEIPLSADSRHLRCPNNHGCSPSPRNDMHNISSINRALARAVSSKKFMPVLYRVMAFGLVVALFGLVACSDATAPTMQSVVTEYSLIAEVGALDDNEPSIYIARNINPDSLDQVLNGEWGRAGDTVFSKKSWFAGDTVYVAVRLLTAFFISDSTGSVPRFDIRGGVIHALKTPSQSLEFDSVINSVQFDQSARDTSGESSLDRHGSAPLTRSGLGARISAQYQAPAFAVGERNENMYTWIDHLIIVRGVLKGVGGNMLVGEGQFDYRFVGAFGYTPQRLPPITIRVLGRGPLNLRAP